MLKAIMLELGILIGGKEAGRQVGSILAR